MTYKLTAHTLSILQDQLSKLQKTARKIGQVAPALTVEGTEDITHEDGSVTRYTLVSITGDAPRINGWVFVGKIEWVEGQPLISVGLTGENIPASFRQAVPVCDHCQVRRNRNAIFILRSEAGDQWKQVGRTCLKDFTGHADPNAIASYAESLNDFIADIAQAEYEDHGYRSGRKPELINTRRFVACVISAVRSDGYFVTRKQAEEKNTLSTSDRVISAMFPPISSQEKPLVPTQADLDEADKIISWANQIDANTTNDYLYNLRVMAGASAFDLRRSGLVASMVVAYRREKDQLNTKSAKPVSQHVGKIGDKISETLTVKNSVECNNQYSSILYTFEDQAGNVYIWFASHAVAEVGQTYTVTGTIKDHTEFRNVKQTVLTRCKVN